MVNFEELKSECYGYFKKNSSREFELTQQLEEEGYDTISLTWGMTNYDSLVETFKQLKKPKRFVVLGCSIGYQCFVWNQMYPDIPCVGIDIFEHRVNWGANMIQKHRIKNVTLLSGDMDTLAINDGDLVWQNNLLFDEETVVDYNQRLLQRRDVEIVSFQSIESFEASLIRIGMISNSRDILIHNGSEFKSMKTCEIYVNTSWAPDQNIYYYYPDRPCEGAFDVDHLPEEILLDEDDVSTYEKMLMSRKRIVSQTLKRLNNKNESKKIFEQVGFNVPRRILYTNQETDIEQTLRKLESFVAKPAHWSESVDVHIKRPGQSVDEKEISKRLNERISMSDQFNWRRHPISGGIPFKETEAGILVEEYIDVVYELKVFVVFGDPMVCDLRDGPTELHNIDYIRKENKYLDWDREYELIKKLAREIRVDFFRIDFLYDGEKLYANEITFMPGTTLPEDVSYSIERRMRSTYTKLFHSKK